tara:strand:+ start:172 stop:435 length:264 start_codon:yes stop_codon:yes gene_type:complete
MESKKLPNKTEVYSDGDIYEYKTILNKHNCYIQAIFLNDAFDTFAIFEAEIGKDHKHIIPEEVIVSSCLESVRKEWEEITLNYYTNN